MPKELLIKGGHVVTVDPDLHDLPVGDVLVTDGVITAVGPSLAPASGDAEVIDVAGRLVIPGIADVETVIVGGDIVKRDGKLVGDRAGHALELMHATRQRLRA